MSEHTAESDAGVRESTRLSFDASVGAARTNSGTERQRVTPPGEMP